MSEEMKTKQVEHDFSEPLDEADAQNERFDEGNRDWRLAMEHATFQHKEDCQFLFFVSQEWAIAEYKNLGFSKRFIAECEIAHKAGFQYVNFTS